MKYKAVFFDLDGTLINSIGDLHASTNAALKMNNLPTVSLEKVRNSIGNGIRLLIERVCPEGTELKIVDKVFEDFKEYYKNHLDIHTTVYDGIIDVLKEIKRRNMYAIIVSNKFYPGVEKISKEYFGDLIDLYIGQNEKFKTKPDQGMINYGLQKFNLKKEQCLYCGDSNVDILTAKIAGMKTLAVTYGFKTKEELLPYKHDNCVFIDHPLDIIKYLGD